MSKQIARIVWLDDSTKDVPGRAKISDSMAQIRTDTGEDFFIPMDRVRYIRLACLEEEDAVEIMEKPKVPSGGDLSAIFPDDESHRMTKCDTCGTEYLIWAMCPRCFSPGR